MKMKNWDVTTLMRKGHMCMCTFVYALTNSRIGRR